MPKLSASSLLNLVALAMSAVAVADAQKTVVLPAGTPVRLSVTRTVTSGTDRQGDTATFEVLESVFADGVEVIAKNTIVTAAITTSRPLRSGGKGSTLSVKLGEFEFPSGVRMQLALKPPVPPIMASVAGVQPVPVTLEASPTYSAYETSTDASMARGFQVTAYVQASVVLDTGKLNPSSAPPIVKPLTNEDVIALFHSGQAEDKIVSTILVSAGQYRTGPEDIAVLKKAGLTSRIIEALLSSGGAK